MILGGKKIHAHTLGSAPKELASEWVGVEFFLDTGG